MAARSWNGPGECSAAARSSIASPAAMAAWSHRDRSWSGSSTRSPASENRAAARACWNVSSAASPHASASPRQAGRHHAGQPDRVAGEVAVLGAAVGGHEALVVHQRDDRQDVGEPLGQHVVGGHGEGDPGRHDLALGADDPLRQRALVDQERPRDLRRRHADDRPQGERQPSLGRERRVAAREEQRQPVVGGRRTAVVRRLDLGLRGRASASWRVRRRTRSRALCRAAVCSQAAGLFGGPSRRHASSASVTAVCTASSARSKSWNWRASRATSRPDSSRRVRARSPSVCWAGVTRTGCSPRPSAGSRRRRRAARGAARS